MLRVVFVTLLAVVALARTAGADPLPTTHWMTPSPPGETYYRMGLSFGSVDAIEHNFWGLRPGFGAPAGDDLLGLQPSLRVGGPTARMGYVFDEEVDAPWGGRELRVELAGSFTSGDGRDSASIPASPYAVISLDGTAVFPTVFLPATGAVETSHRGVELAVHFASLYKLTDRLELAPTLSFVGTRAKQSTDLDMVLPIFGTFTLDFQQHSTLTRHRFGPELGAQLTYRLRDRLLLHGVAGIGIHYLHTRMKANDCAFGVTGAPCTGALYQTQVDETDRSFGHRATLSAGFTWFVGRAEISVAATGAGMRRPRMRGARLLTNGFPVVAAPADITYDNALNLGLTTELRLRF